MGKAGHQGDEAQLCPSTSEGGGVGGGSGGDADGLPVFIVLVHQHLDAVGVGW